MKTCSRCEKIKPESEFWLKSRAKSRLQPWCKKCLYEYREARGWYNKTQAEQQKRWHRRRKAWVDSLKMDKPCTDCGRIYPPCVMDFHHRDKGSKVFTISKVARHGDKAKLLAEIEKCDLLCANCHRIRTHERGCRPTLQDSAQILLPTETPNLTHDR